MIALKTKNPEHSILGFACIYPPSALSSLTLECCVHQKLPVNLFGGNPTGEALPANMYHSSKMGRVISAMFEGSSFKQTSLARAGCTLLFPLRSFKIGLRVFVYGCVFVCVCVDESDLLEPPPRVVVRSNNKCSNLFLIFQKTS